MEFLRNFIKEGYLKAVGKMEDYKIILGASAYFDKGILKESDLMEINEAINKQYIVEEPSMENEEEFIEEPAEETIEEETEIKNEEV